MKDKEIELARREALEKLGEDFSMLMLSAADELFSVFDDEEREIVLSSTLSAIKKKNAESYKEKRHCRGRMSAVRIFGPSRILKLYEDGKQKKIIVSCGEQKFEFDNIKSAFALCEYIRELENKFNRTLSREALRSVTPRIITSPGIPLSPVVTVKDNWAAPIKSIWPTLVTKKVIICIEK